jgi:predicted pyridoxine 5'-phosphate oxidase superfamily flavin-nucleotide-binding protein
MAATTAIEVSSEAELRELVGVPGPRTATKERPALDDVDKQWLARSPFCLVATAGADGTCEVSPKGDPAGSCSCSTTRRSRSRPAGQQARRRHAQHPAQPTRRDAVHRPRPRRHAADQRAGAIVREAPFLDDLVVRGNRPKLAIVIDIDEVFFHCAKAFMRSQLWQPETWQPEALPDRAAIAKAIERPDDPLEVLEQYYGPQYADGLYEYR